MSPAALPGERSTLAFLFDKLVECIEGPFHVKIFVHL